MKMHLSTTEDPSWGCRYYKKTSQSKAIDQAFIQEATGAIHYNQRHIYISKNELLWTSPKRECWNMAEAFFPNSVLSINFIKGSHTNSTFY